MNPRELIGPQVYSKARTSVLMDEKDRVIVYWQIEASFFLGRLVKGD